MPESKTALPRNERTCHKVTEVSVKGLPLMKSAKDAESESNETIRHTYAEGHSTK